MMQDTKFFFTDLTKEKSCNLSLINLQAIEKSITSDIIMGDSAICKGSNETLSWQRLDNQIIRKNLDYLVKRKILTNVI